MIAEGIIVVGALCLFLGIAGFFIEYLPKIIRERAEKRRKPVSQKDHSYMRWY